MIQRITEMMEFHNNRLRELGAEKRTLILEVYAKDGIKVGALVSYRDRVGKIDFISTAYYPNRPSIKVLTRKKDGGWSKNTTSIYSDWELCDAD